MTMDLVVIDGPNLFNTVASRISGDDDLLKFYRNRSGHPERSDFPGVGTKCWGGRTDDRVDVGM